MCAQADYCLANVDVDDEGAVMISGKDQEQMDACAAKILELTAEDARGGGRPAPRQLSERAAGAIAAAAHTRRCRTARGSARHWCAAAALGSMLRHACIPRRRGRRRGSNVKSGRSATTRATRYPRRRMISLSPEASARCNFVGFFSKMRAASRAVGVYRAPRFEPR